MTRTIKGFTRFTIERGGTKASGFVLQDSAGNDWCVWVDTTGDLRTAEAATVEASAFNPNSSGTVVGSQS
jgi:hypothetical protein